MASKPRTPEPDIPFDVMGPWGPMRRHSRSEQRRMDQEAQGKVYRGTLRTPMSQAKRDYLLSKLHADRLAASNERQRARGVFVTAAGTIPGYGTTAGKIKLRRLRKAATLEATKIMDTLIKNGIVDKADAGNEALLFGIETIKLKDENGRPLNSVTTRLAAAKLVLEYTMAKPEQKQKVTVQTAEDWLENLPAPE